MNQTRKLRLRYFAARGRAQFLRAYLTVRGVDFDDERVPLDEGYSAWLAIREDSSLTGPFHKLPVLHVDGRLIPEMSVIASFLHARLGDDKTLGEELNERHNVLLSACFTDIMFLVAMVIWADIMYAGVDMAQVARRSLERLAGNLATFDATLGDWNWLDSIDTRPVTVADCFLWESVDMARATFGPHLDLEAVPRLQQFHAQHPARIQFEALLAEHPPQITGRLGEPDAIANIRSLLASQA
jgi:glutathione S-transferase